MHSKLLIRLITNKPLTGFGKQTSQLQENCLTFTLIMPFRQLPLALDTTSFKTTSPYKSINFPAQMEFPFAIWFGSLATKTLQKNHRRESTKVNEHLTRLLVNGGALFKNLPQMGCKTVFSLKIVNAFYIYFDILMPILFLTFLASC